MFPTTKLPSQEAWWFPRFFFVPPTLSDLALNVQRLRVPASYTISVRFRARQKPPQGHWGTRRGDFIRLNIHIPLPATWTKACPPTALAKLFISDDWWSYSNSSSAPLALELEHFFSPQHPPNLPWCSTTRSHTTRYTARSTSFMVTRLRPTLPSTTTRTPYYTISAQSTWTWCNVFTSTTSIDDLDYPVAPAQGATFISSLL